MNKEDINKETIDTEEVITETESMDEVTSEESTIDSQKEGGESEVQTPDVATLVAEFDNKYKRLQADFDNFRRRTNQEKTQLATFIKGNVLEDFLPILDNFERALAVPATEDNKAFLEGFQMIQDSLIAMLSKHGLAAIEAVGKPFDPNFHQAIMQVQSDEYEDDTVAEVLQTGYTVDGRTIRPAMVKVVNNG